MAEYEWILPRYTSGSDIEEMLQDAQCEDVSAHLDFASKTIKVKIGRVCFELHVLEFKSPVLCYENGLLWLEDEKSCG